MIAVFCMLDLLLFYGAPCALQFVQNQDQLGVSKGLWARLGRGCEPSEQPSLFRLHFATEKRTPKALV